MRGGELAATDWTDLQNAQFSERQFGKPLRIHVERFNPARRLYERLGFRQIEDRGVYLFMQWRVT